MIIKISRRIKILKQLLNTMISKKVILVYQMGKVGSTSLLQALVQDSESPVFQVHRFNLKNPHYVNRGIWRTFIRSMWAKLLLILVQGKEIRIISPVRQPIDRNISDFFQTIDHFQQRYLSEAPLDLQEIVKVFYAYYPHFSYETWYDLQIRDVFGIDIYSKPFDTEKKFSIYTGVNNVQLLIFRIEDIDDNNVLEAIRQFSNCNSLSFSNENSANQKWYSSIYSEFKNLELEPWYRSMMRDTRTFRFFYGDR
jgi:hypothetical protein